MKNDKLKLTGAVACVTLGLNLLTAAPAKPVAKVDVFFDHPNGLYQKDDKVSFVVKVTNPDGTPATNGTVYTSLSNWGGKRVAGENVDLATTKDKPLAYRGVYAAKPVALGEPGFMRCIVHYTAADQDVWGGEAVAVSPREIRNGTPRPKDFDAFWDAAIANLDKTVPADIRCEKDEKFSTKTHACFRLSCATAGEGRRTWGFLAVPNEALADATRAEGASPTQPKAERVPPKFPVRISVPGAGPGCYWWTPKEGVITLTMNVFDFEPGWNLHVDWKAHYERYNEMHKRWGAKFGTKEAWPAGMGSKIEDSFYYGAILGVNRLVNWLCTQPYVDKKDVTYSGQSQGGAFGIYLAALNTNLTAATISEPALTGLDMHKVNRADGWPNPYGCHTNEAQRAIVEKVVPYLDGVNFTPRIKCRVRFGVGFIDQLCPPHCVYAAYNALNPIIDRRIINGLGVGHGTPKETYEPFAKRLEESWKAAKPIAWEEPCFNPEHPELTDRVPYPDRAAPVIYLYVAPNGDDAAEGTIEKPLKTVIGARDRLRQLTSNGGRTLDAGGAVVFVRGGTYAVTNTIAFNRCDGSRWKGAPIVYRAYPGETPILTGGFTFRGSKPLNDAAVKARLPPETKAERVRVLDLKAAGYDDFTPQAAYGYRPLKPCHTVTDLYRDGVPLDVAVAPNPDVRLEDFYKIGAVLDPKHDVFKADFPMMEKWAEERDVMAQGWWTFLWASTTLPVEKIDPVAKTVAVTREGNVFHYHATSNRVFTLENGMPALDREVEWVFDRAAGRAYVIEDDAKGEATSTKHVYTMTRLAKPMVTVTSADNLRLEGFTFEYGRTDAIVVSNVTRFAFLGNTVRKFGGRGVQVLDAKEARIQNNNLNNFGFAALYVTGGDRVSLTPSGNIIENNEISFTGRRQRTSPESSTCVVKGCGNVLTHNFLHDTPGSALRLDGNENRVTFNRFERCSYLSDDNGAIDMCNDMSAIGNRFFFNEFYNLGYPKASCGNGGIRLDDFISQQYLYGNRFVNASSGKFGATQFNGGRDNVVANNWIEGSEWAFSEDPAGASWFFHCTRMDYNLKKYASGAISVYDEPYISRYARTPDILREGDTMVNYYRNNVIVGAKALRHERSSKQAVLDGNALFKTAPSAAELAKTRFKPIPPAGSAGTYKVAPEVEIERPPLVELKGREGIGRTLAKLEAGGEVKIGFFGGSITAMHGWRSFILEKLRKDYPKAKIVEVNASLGGAGSLAGAFRMAHDILNAKCDLMILEYATNDTEHSPTMNLRSMEGCVRQAWASKPEMDLLFVYTMNASQKPAYDAGYTSDTAFIHDKIADHYGIPTVNFCVELEKRLKSGKWLYMAADARKRWGEKWQDGAKKAGIKVFTFDNCHPGSDGHQLYHEVLSRAFDALRARHDKPANHAAKMSLKPLAADNMENAKLVFPGETIFSKGDWRILEKDHPETKKFARETDRIWFTDRVGAKIRFRFSGRIVQMYNIRTPKSGALKISIDGCLPFTRVLADPWSAGGTLIWSEPLYNGSDGIHTVEIEVMRNPKHGGTELELAGLQLDGALVDIPKDRVFFVGAHPDDTEGFAATAFLLRDKYDIHVIDLTRGELGLGMPGLKDGSTAKTRMAEEAAACAYLGATPHFLDEIDGFAYAGKTSVTRLAKLIRALKPVAIFTHWPVDTHCDHVQTAAVTRRAVQEAGFRGEYYFYEVLRSQTVNFRPIYSVDVSKTIDQKIEMLRKYVCQNPNDSLAQEKGDQAKVRGAERRPKCQAAEVFTTYSGQRIEKGVLENLEETALVTEHNR